MCNSCKHSYRTIPISKLLLNLFFRLYSSFDKIHLSRNDILFKTHPFSSHFNYNIRPHADNNEYMSFGISPDRRHTVMVGADVVVAWVDKETGKGYASDYYLDAKSQCSGQRGSCPDTRLLVRIYLKTMKKISAHNTFIFAFSQIPTQFVCLTRPW